MSDEGRISSKSLEDTFRAFGDRDFLFVRPGGNWGDGLIHRGAEVLAARLGLRWRSVAEDDFAAEHVPHGSVVYLHGGGGFNSWCSGRAPRLLGYTLRSHAGPVIQGPQSIETSSEFLAILRQLLSTDTSGQLIFFVREQTSFNALVHVLSARVDLRLDHDTALRLTRDDLLSQDVRLLPRYKLLALREDNEAPPRTGAAWARGVRLDPAYYAASFDHWLRIHARSRAIVTDRTHSAIAGAILGIPTMLLPGSYHKNRSIWEYSLVHRGVKWSESVPSESRSRIPRLGSADMPRPLRYILNRYKVQRAVFRLRGVPLS